MTNVIIVVVNVIAAVLNLWYAIQNVGAQLAIVSSFIAGINLGSAILFSCAAYKKKRR